LEGSTSTRLASDFVKGLGPGDPNMKPVIDSLTLLTP
jgi:hypothetical protein